MVSGGVVPDEKWAALADSDADTREAEMALRYKQLAALSEEERQSQLTAMAHAEYSLPDAKLRPFTISRMRTWLALDEATARTVANSYDQVMRRMPGPVAMRRVALVQSLAAELSVDEEERLRQLVPGVFAGAPSRRTGLETRESELEVQKPERKRGWWPFGRR